jgi:glycosyltransferase involved in cell wall biosynthesis
MEATPARVVLGHDWLTGLRGGEKCLEVLCREWPHARILTLIHRPGSAGPVIGRLPVTASWLNLLPAVHRYYRWLLPVMPLAVPRVPPCDLLVSFSHCVAKSLTPPPGVPHVCYCFTPMRYAWHLRDSYFPPERLGRLPARFIDLVLARLREWDRATAGRVSHFIAISRAVRERIHECYGRESAVIYPPVDTDFYTPSGQTREDFYLAFSAFAPYKRLDLAVEACRRLGRKLIVIGTGQDARRLQALAVPGVTFLGWQPDEVVRDHLRRCRALLFPGEEDFGIVPVEAMACGTPVVAYGRGGAAETVIAPASGREPTGLLFAEQSLECLADAIQTLERQAGDLDPRVCRRQADRFNAHRFREELLAYLAGVTRGVAPGRKAA